MADKPHYRRKYHIYNGGRDTDVSLKEYFETKLEGMERALAIAKEVVEKQLEGFPLEYMRKSEYEKAHEQICHQVNDVRKILDEMGLDMKNNIYPKLENKAAQTLVTIAVTSIVSGLFVGLTGALIRHLWG